MRNPLRNTRIEINWQRALELLNIGVEIPIKVRTLNGDEIEVTTESQLNDYFGNGRTSFGIKKEFLTKEELEILEDLDDEGYYSLSVEKEVYPGVYKLGEF